MEISDENIFDQKLKSEEMNHMMLWRKTISGREKSKSRLGGRKEIKENRVCRRRKC